MLTSQIKKVLSEIETNKVDDLIIAKVALRNLDAGYQDAGIETPEWVIDGINDLEREITNRNRAQLTKDLKKAKARRYALASADEKRKTLDSQIAELEKKLA